MKARIVKIGNSRGIRIPKPLIEQTGLKDEVEINMEDDHLVIKSSGQPRAGWTEAFSKMADAGNDVLLDRDAPLLSTWDEDEWAW